MLTTMRSNDAYLGLPHGPMTSSALRCFRRLWRGR
jgi:hypothetical protein